MRRELLVWRFVISRGGWLDAAESGSRPSARPGSEGNRLEMLTSAARERRSSCQPNPPAAPEAKLVLVALSGVVVAFAVGVGLRAPGHDGHV